MPLFVLTETSAGYALLKAKDKKLLDRDDLGSEVETAEQVCSLLKLKHFQKFDSAAEALEEVSALVESKVTPTLARLLDQIKDEKKASLVVADPKLGTAISKLPQLSIKPVSDGTTLELFRSIRDHLPSLIPGLLPDDISTMSLGLSHSLSRHKLKFSPDKIDTMIVQAVALLDDLDKELNTYAMRVKEWYGWHFPEMGRIVNDNLAYARVILKMGMRSNAAHADLAEVLPEEIEGAVKGAAEVSMGTEITEEDIENIQALAEQVVSFTEYRQTLSSYLSARMTALAPNLTALVGELVGARLIAHSGSLLNLAKSPASTIQILGAEKALFRALKTKHDTPKYGLIYHASLVGQATGKNKGKIARVLAAKAALGLRADAYANWGVQGEEETDIIPEEEKAALGLAARAKVERRLASLEGKPVRTKGTATIAPVEAQQQPSKWEVKEARKYNPDADALAGDEPAAVKEKLAKHAIRSKIELPDGPKPVKKDLESDEDSDDESEDGDDSSDSPTKVNGNSSSTLKGSSEPAGKHSKGEKKEKKRSKDAEYEEPARQVGLSVTRYKRKLERGEIRFEADGTPVAVSKKELKKARKKADKLAKVADVDGESKKRKHAGDGEERKKKKEKKERKTAA